MRAANRLKAALDRGQGASMGVWQMIPGSNVSRTLARTGVDWVLVDCEHGNIDGMSACWTNLDFLHLGNLEYQDTCSTIGMFIFYIR